MKNAFNIPFILLILIGCASEEVSEGISVQTEIDTTVATIGDILHFSILTTGSGTDPVTISEMDPQEVMEVRTQYWVNNKMEMEIVFWDTGNFSIPAMNVQFLNADSSEKLALQTDPIDIVIVSSTDPASVGAMKPVKDPVPVSRPIPAIMVVLISLIVISLLAMIWLSIRYKREKFFKDIGVVFPQPDEVAMEKLGALKRSMNTELDMKAFYVDLSYILREYVEHSLFVKTLEMTTADIRSTQSELPYSEEELTGWLDLLERADLIKYAKMLPKHNTCTADLDSAESFVRSTISYWKQVDPPSIIPSELVILLNKV